MIVNYTQCKYKFKNATIKFNPDEIDLGTVQLKDTLNNIATVSGKIYHTFFNDFGFDNIHFSNKKNTPIKYNEKKIIPNFMVR